MLTWLDKAEADAAKRKYDVNLLLQTRLAPDMFPLVRQFQSSCDTAKFCAARLSGKTAPSHPDTETTVSEIRARIQGTLEFLGTVSENDCADAASRKIELSYIPGMVQDAADYTYDMAIPNFYFHVSMAYALLRHAGVDVGKMDFLGELKLKPKTAETARAEA